MDFRDGNIVIAYCRIIKMSVVSMWGFMGMNLRDGNVVICQIVFMFMMSCVFLLFQKFKHNSLLSDYIRLIKNVITRLLIKSANKLPIRGMSRYAFTEGSYLSHTACIFAIAFGVAPIPNPHVPDTKTAAS